MTDGRWKLCIYPAIGHRQLFDLATDPDELINLAARAPFQHHVDLTGTEREPDRWQPEWIRETFFAR